MIGAAQGITNFLQEGILVFKQRVSRDAPFGQGPTGKEKARYARPQLTCFLSQCTFPPDPLLNSAIESGRDLAISLLDKVRTLLGGCPDQALVKIFVIVCIVLSIWNATVQEDARHHRYAAPLSDNAGI